MLKALKKLAKGKAYSEQDTLNSLDSHHSLDIPVFREVDIRKHFELKGLIGFPGTFGEVRVAVNISTGKTYAVKMLKMQKHIQQDMINSEIEIMSSLHHPSIASIVAVYESKKKVSIVMEKYDGGDLFDLVVSNGGRIQDEKFAARIIKQILEGLQYLHSKRVVHGDVKLCNILLTSNRSQVKIIDFGVSQVMKPGEMLHAEVGSPSFIAPEVLMGSYNELCDMWSLGCVVFIMLFGFNPFNPKAIPALPNREKICESILKGFCHEVKPGYGAFFPEKIPVSEEARDFVSGLLTSEWRHRLTSTEALDHPWIVRNCL